MTFTWRALTRADIPAAAAVANAAFAADGTGEMVTEELMAEDFGNPRLNLASDTIGLWDGDDLAGLGSVHGREELVDGRALVTLRGQIHPRHRGRGLGRRLLTYLEGLGEEWAAKHLPGAPVRLRASGGLAGSSTQQLLEQSGYRPDNYFVTMEVDLSTWADPGTQTVAIRPGEELREAIREAHNDAFRDHRNYSPIPADQWAHFAASSSMRPEQSQVVLVDGRVLAYALATEEKPGTLHLGLVGTRREARGRGLAKDVLIASLRAAREAGFDISELEVDQSSPTGADRLYASVGYRPVRVLSRYTRDVS
ncbi:MAG TPA: GNAT family N-acetyltransferase [Beutenbergiaceae bacterium]|nr:GNAT family N-acetyltransferase [Beutenbergiaceae bacterium]